MLGSFYIVFKTLTYVVGIGHMFVTVSIDLQNLLPDLNEQRYQHLLLSGKWNRWKYRTESLPCDDMDNA